MRKDEKKTLLGKITVHIGNVITYKNNVERWTSLEIAERYGVPNNRLTEYKNFQKYNKPISETFLAAFIGGGLLSIDDIKKNVNMTESEKRYVETFAFFSDTELKDGIDELKGLGVDVHAMVRKEVLKAKKAARENKE